MHKSLATDKCFVEKNCKVNLGQLAWAYIARQCLLAKPGMKAVPKIR